MLSPTSGKFASSDFRYDAQANTCVCPAGKALYSNGVNCMAKGRQYCKFTGAKQHCVPYELRDQCLRTPDKTLVRQVAFFPKSQDLPLRHTEAMKQKIDSATGRALFGRRIAKVEPVSGKLRYNKRLDRFALRGQKKVSTQWQLYCLVRNIENTSRVCD